MATLASTVSRKKSSSTAARNPQFYQRQRRDFIRDMINHENETVRVAACSNSRCPSQMLKERLSSGEDSKNVIKAILMNPNTADTVIDAFCAEDPRGDWFDSVEDADLTTYLQNRGEDNSEDVPEEKDEDDAEDMEIVSDDEDSI